MELMPFTVDTVFSLASALKLQKYRSAKNDLSAASIEAERRGAVLTGTLRRALKDSVRSCARGIGLGKRCEGLIFELLPGLPGGRLAWCAEGPMNPRSVIMMNSWFMSRDSEVGGAELRSITFNPAPAPLPLRCRRQSATHVHWA